MPATPSKAAGFPRPPFRSTLRSAFRLFRSGDFVELTRRVPTYLRRVFDQQAPTDYPTWRELHVVPTLEELAVIKKWERQLPPDLYHIVDLKNLAESMEMFAPEALVVVVEDAVLHEGALMTFSRATDQNPEALVFYGDHEIVDHNQNCIDAYLKPNWNPELALGHDFAGPVLAVKARHLVDSVSSASPSSTHDLLLSITAGLRDDQIFHIPLVLSTTHRRWPSSDPRAVAKLTGLPPKDITTDSRSGACRIHWPLPNSAVKVSVVIPTKNRGRMLRRCLEGVLNTPSNQNVEVVVVDHDSTQRKARHLIDDFSSSGGGTVIHFDGPFNFSQMVNLGVNASTGEVICLLNNDTEILNPDWLTELTSQALRPEVGVVGALLLFPNGTIQHAGVHPGLGGFMGHGHKHIDHGDPGYHGRLTVAHQVAAVTGACLALRRTVWDLAGGMDEGLPVAFNDIDLCLKVRQLGLRVVFTPHAVLNHHESVSRGTDDNPARSARLADEHRKMTDRWGELLTEDPAYHPNLSRHSSGFSLAESPTTYPPWREPE